MVRSRRFSAGRGGEDRAPSPATTPWALKRLLRTVTNRTLDFFFPRRCAGCGREGRFLCLDCLGTLRPLQPPWCSQCGRPYAGSGSCPDCRGRPHQLRGIRAAYIYEGALRQAVLEFKYRGVSAFAEELAPLLENHLREHPLAADLIVPVPLFGDRLRERGYNQAELLARHLSVSLSLPMEGTALYRTRKTPPQARLVTWEDRRENMAGAFGARPEAVRGRRVLVLDDVCTTGATLDACGQALRAAGAASAWGMALAREV